MKNIYRRKRSVLLNNKQENSIINELDRELDSENRIKNGFVKLDPEYRKLRYVYNEIERELCRRSLSYFLKKFWGVIIEEELKWNWHMEVLCEELQYITYYIINRKPKPYDLVINIPPGSSKSTICSIMYPVWLWVLDPSIRIISGSYSYDLSLDLSLRSRNILQSTEFRELFPEIELSNDQNVKGHYINTRNGERFATSTGGTVTGSHAHVLIVDDPLNPKEAVSEITLKRANRWMDETLSSRKVDKANTPTILIMQRLHEDDCSANMLRKRDEGKKVKHICLPAELTDDVSPEAYKQYYSEEGLLDKVRMPSIVLNEMRLDLGEYGYACQMLQRPAPPEGGFFRPYNINIVYVQPRSILRTVRYWDKAGTSRIKNPNAAYTCGVKMSLLDNGTYLIEDVIRGQWEASEREQIIKQTAQRDGQRVIIGIEQEPGSGGKESAQNTIRNLAGFTVKADRPSGDKQYRADPFAAQVNAGNVYMIKGNWNVGYLKELEMFPNGRFKDQVDASSGAFAMLNEGASGAGSWR